jgi:hypothetical protein
LTPALLLAAVMLEPAAAVWAAEQAAAPDGRKLLLGVWQLNLSKSRYVPGPPPLKETRTYTQTAEGVKGVIARTHHDGQLETIEYLANYDNAYPVTGAKEYDGVRLKRIDDYTTEAVLSHAGRVFGIARRVISQDGRTMTITFRRESQGVLVNNVAIYEKVEI